MEFPAIVRLYIYIYIVFLIPRRNSGDQVLIRVGICLRGTLTLLRRSVDPRFVSIIAVSLVSKSDRLNLGEEISFYRDEKLLNFLRFFM